MIFRRNIEAFGIVTLALLLGLIKCQTCDKVLCKKRDIKRIENELTDKISKLENKLDTLNTKLEDDMEIFGKMLIDTPEIKRTGFEAKVLDQLTKLNTKLNRMTENEACMRTRERFFRTYENGLVPLCEDGWLVIAYRYNGEVAFHNRTWDEYKNGFGAPHGEYFLGFEPIRSLLKREEFKLRVELGLSFRGGIRWGIAGYDLFFISEETENYELRLGDYNSTGTSNIANSLSLHTNSKFQTVDRNSGLIECHTCQRRDVMTLLNEMSEVNEGMDKLGGKVSMLESRVLEQIEQLDAKLNMISVGKENNMT
ncbi:unnamed protein product [Owenia fusiformis]|uniref:Fibrinogen C-terminal domain-containing protein n=1 Tax=Owenia fusiformis TaxID=6347 RepID=A0A8S4N6V0_OWEFU|nr:unnamed protein product [Owenia fusiformis]